MRPPLTARWSQPPKPCCCNEEAGFSRRVDRAEGRYCSRREVSLHSEVTHGHRPSGTCSAPACSSPGGRNHPPLPESAAQAGQAGVWPSLTNGPETRRETGRAAGVSRPQPPPESQWMPLTTPDRQAVRVLHHKAQSLPRFAEHPRACARSLQPPNRRPGRLCTAPCWGSVCLPKTVPQFVTITP